MIAPDGWVGGSHHIIIPFRIRDPTWKLRTYKSSTRVEFQVWPKCGNQLTVFEKVDCLKKLIKSASQVIWFQKIIWYLNWCIQFKSWHFWFPYLKLTVKQNWPYPSLAVTHGPDLSHTFLSYHRQSQSIVTMSTISVIQR